MVASSIGRMTVLAIALASSMSVAAEPSINWDAQSGRATLTTGRLELIVETKTGLNARSLRDVENGTAYADRDYSWPGGMLPSLTENPALEIVANGSRSIKFKGRLGPIEIEQRLTTPTDQPGVILETITVGNPGEAPLPTADFKCGFAKRVREGEKWVPDGADVRFCPVPYRRETNGQMQEFPLREVAEHGITYGGWAEPPQPTPIWGAEGWVWSKGTSSFLLAKYNADSMEWSLMEPEKRGTETVIRFGGAGQWKYGHPETSARLLPGRSYSFGETRLQAVAGDWKQAYYAYRDYINVKGCGTPKGYNPPVQWNELYDNEYYGRVCGMGNEYFGPSKPGFCPEYYERNKKLLNEYYSLDLIKGEAAKAKDLGCEALYLDPGWEVGPSRQIWDAERLGSMPSFVKMIREQYGMKGVCFWCSLAGVPPTIGDPSACPKEARVLDKEGRPADLLLCLPSPAFLDTKEKNLLDLCRDGALFLMFDSNQYSGPCYDKTHGHTIPSTREEHAKALFELARRVKVKYPNVLIEMHDPITGPCNIHYTPSYFGYAPPHSFDCLWGHEFMWNPIDDVLSRRAVSLYYYNLAYSIPFYLHINLKTDNENALVFWWFASTIRHLGVGGKGPAPVWEAQKKAMQAYMPLKRFYTQGVFYGLDEMIHAHTLPDLHESVVNVFNLEDKPVQRTVKFRPEEIGLPAGTLKIEGALAQQSGEQISLDLAVPARGHLLLRVHEE